MPYTPPPLLIVNPQPPPDAIVGMKGNLAQNNSGILYEDGRWPAPPHALMEEYAEENTQTEQKVTRFFLTPWSQYEAFRAWVLGWSDSQPQSPGNPAPPYVLTRNLPDQHAGKPWLYAVSCDLVESMGCAVQDPRVRIVRQATGVNADGTQTFNNLPGPDGNPQYRPLNYYAETGPAHGPGASTLSEGAAKVRVEYTPRPYEIRSDLEVYGPGYASFNRWGELSRFVERDEKPAVESLPYYRIASAGSVAANAAGVALNNVVAACLAANVPGATAATIAAAANTAAAGSPLAAAVQAAGTAAIAAGAAPLAAFNSITAATITAAETVAAAAPAGTLAFSSGPFVGQVIPEAGVLLMPTVEVHYTLHEWPDRNVAAYRSLLGKINSADFDGCSTGYPSYPAGTLLLVSYLTERQRNAVGRVCWKIKLVCAHRPQGWNYFPAADGNYYLATFGGGIGGPVPYQSGNFMQFVQVPTPAQYQQLVT